MEKKQWNTPDLTVYGDVATLTQAGQGCVIKVLGINDDFVQNTDNAGSTSPCP
jgi:hypothetical protein